MGVPRCHGLPVEYNEDRCMILKDNGQTDKRPFNGMAWGVCQTISQSVMRAPAG